jgi:hypothetical protein
MPCPYEDPLPPGVSAHVIERKGERDYEKTRSAEAVEKKKDGSKSGGERSGSRGRVARLLP